MITTVVEMKRVHARACAVLVEFEAEDWMLLMTASHGQYNGHQHDCSNFQLISPLEQEMGDNLPALCTGHWYENVTGMSHCCLITRTCH